MSYPNQANMSRPAGIAARLISIDALRGAAALAVVFFHAVMPVTFLKPAPVPGWVGAAALPFSWGFTGVWLFFVISGFCIHLRWTAAAARGELPEVSFLPFWKRRVRRLYPAYLAALVLYLVVLAASRQLPHPDLLGWDIGLHLVMLHNVDLRFTHSINGAFWTLAVEEQLYLAYFLLLALRRRLTWPVILGLCLGVRAALLMASVLLFKWFRWVSLPEDMALSYWFVWALGAIGVEAALGVTPLAPRWRDLRLAAICFAGAAVLSFLLTRRFVTGKPWLVASYLETPLYGVAYFILVNRLAEAERSGRLGSTLWGARILKGAAAVGVFSYSLYLTHNLWVWIPGHYWAESCGWPVAQWVLLCVALAPVAVAFAWLFFRVFERPFLTPAQKQRLPQD